MFICSLIAVLNLMEVINLVTVHKDFFLLVLVFALQEAEDLGSISTAFSCLV